MRGIGGYTWVMAMANFQNRTLYHGDNLEFLRGMNSETVHLIATDPPFNKKRDFHASPDSLASGARFTDRWSWDEDVHEEWVDSIKDDWTAVWSVIEGARGSYGDDMGAFLCWLGVRVMEMHRVLRDDGSMYLHIDHTAHAYVKALMDAIFGHENFRNEIVWAYTGPSNTKRWFPRKHDTILFYAKSDESPFNRDAVRIPYEAETLARRGRLEGKRSIISPSVRHSGRLSDSQVESGYGRGKVVEDWWTDITALTNQREYVGYPTQKPLALYERIILASSKPGEWVLDPFCGCATTPIAAERTGRRWVGMDIWDNAHDIVKRRMEDNRQLLEDIPEIVYSEEPPVRTDDNEVSAPSFRLKTQRPTEAWEKISHREMTRILVDAQGTSDGVICAGCGRTLEKEFMELDHITPKSDRGENHIMNRILLCRPCNGRKRDNLTLRGLMNENKRVGWMRDEGWATVARDRAADRAEWVRENFGSSECEGWLGVGFGGG